MLAIRPGMPSVKGDDLRGVESPTRRVESPPSKERSPDSEGSGGRGEVARKGVMAFSESKVPHYFKAVESSALE